MKNYLQQGMFGAFGNLLTPEDDEALAEQRAIQYAELEPGTRALFGAHMAGRDLGRVAGTLAGADVRSPGEKNRDAVASIKAAVAQSGAAPGSDEYYQLLISEFSKHGLLDAANRVQSQWEASKRNHAQTKLYDAQAAKAERVSPRDKLTEKYWEIVEQIQTQGEHQDPNLIQARDNLARALGIKPEVAPKQESADWSLVQPTQYSPGYMFNRRTGEQKPIGGRIGKPGENSAEDDSPFAALTPEARKAAERQSGKEVGEWVSGGRASALRGIDALRDVQARLRSNPDLVNDPLSSQAPDWARATTAGGRAAIDARDTVRTAIQATLRQVMGSQFTEKEATDMFNRAWDPRLGVEENVERLERAIVELEEKLQAKDSLSRGRRPQERAPRQPNGGGTVRVRLPDGRIGNIPRSTLAEAKRKGAVEIQ
jgi:hypothetical protein